MNDHCSSFLSEAVINGLTEAILGRKDLAYICISEGKSRQELRQLIRAHPQSRVERNECIFAGCLLAAGFLHS